MAILFTVCGRAGSKGFQSKNLKDFLGVPLVYYTLAAIRLWQQRADEEIDVVLNTDSEALCDIVTAQKSLPVQIIHRRAELGGDTVPKVSVIRDCLDQMEARTGKTYEMVVDLDITSPLRTVDDVAAAIEKKRARADTDVVYSVTGSRRNPYFNMVCQRDGFFTKAIPSHYTARQQAPVFYDMNASIYAYSPRALREKKPEIFINDRCDALSMWDTAVLDIDSEEDYKLMQVIASCLFEQDPAFGAVREAAQALH